MSGIGLAGCQFAYFILVEASILTTGDLSCCDRELELTPKLRQIKQVSIFASMIKIILITVTKFRYLLMVLISQKFSEYACKINDCGFYV